MSELKMKPEARIALYERLARTGFERALAVAEEHPALAAYYADLALAYDRTARKHRENFELGCAPIQSGSTPRGEK